MIYNQTMIDEILSLSKHLISIRSVQENPKALSQALETAVSSLKDFTIEKFENNGVKSVLVYASKKRPSKFKVILNGHLDVTPGKEYQYKPKIRDDRLYGVGALDMKANLACLVMVFKDVANKVDYPLGLQLVTDEEIGGFDGTKHQIEKGVRSEFVIAGETTNLNIVNQAKGVLWLKISTRGKTAHGAYPWKGRNSIWEMNKFLARLEKRYPIPNQEKWITTINLSRIQTGNKTFNKIPDDCEVWLDVRYIHGQTDTIINSIKKLMLDGFNLEVVAKEPAFDVDINNQYIQKLKKIAERVSSKKIKLYGAQGSSDARHFTQINCSGVEFGAIGEGIGGDNEWVDIGSLKKYYQILRDFLHSL